MPNQYYQPYGEEDGDEFEENKSLLSSTGNRGFMRTRETQAIMETLASFADKL